MTIDVYDYTDTSLIKVISDEQFFTMCSYDIQIYKDYIKYLKKHQFIQPLNEYWYLRDEYNSIVLDYGKKPYITPTVEFI